MYMMDEGDDDGAASSWAEQVYIAMNCSCIIEYYLANYCVLIKNKQKKKNTDQELDI